MDDVIGVDAEQAFVEGPVAEFAEGEAVAGIVIVAASNLFLIRLDICDGSFNTMSRAV